LPKGRGVDDPEVPQGARQREGAPAGIQEQGGEAGATDTTESAIEGQEEPDRRQAGIEFAIQQFAAHGGPADFGSQLDFDAVLLEQAEFLRGDRDDRFEVRHVADPDHPGFLGSAKSVQCRAPAKAHAAAQRTSCAKERVPEWVATVNLLQRLPEKLSTPGASVRRDRR
jgi:hypothetical protein